MTSILVTKLVSKLSENLDWIRDPEKNFSRIQGLKKAPDVYGNTGKKQHGLPSRTIMAQRYNELEIISACDLFQKFELHNLWQSSSVSRLVRGRAPFQRRHGAELGCVRELREGCWAGEGRAGPTSGCR